MALLTLPLAAKAEITIHKPQIAGPVRLVCFHFQALQEHVDRLTRNQIIGVRHAARDGDIQWPCDDVQLPVGTILLHERWLQTRDNWWVLGQTVQYPGGSQWVTVDPIQKTYLSPPSNYLRYYQNSWLPPVRDRSGQSQAPVDSPAEGVHGMDVDEGQAYIRRQLGLPPKE
jgi:hypothetical protein